MYFLLHALPNQEKIVVGLSDHFPSRTVMAVRGNSGHDIHSVAPQTGQFSGEALNKKTRIRMRLPEDEIVLRIEKPQFVVKLRKDLLEVDLKKGVRKEIEEVLEARPFIRESLGAMFQWMIPLDVPLYLITSVEADKKGTVKVVIPGRKDATIRLKPSEAKKLVDALEELIPIEKQKEHRRIQAYKQAEREREKKFAEALKHKRF